MKYQFPKDFLWGSATSGPQCEGAADIDRRSPSVWDLWFDKEPERFFDGVGPQDTSTFYKNYKQDIKLLKKTGHNSFRTSIQWTRLIPDGKNINQKAVDFYQSVIDAQIEEGITPIIGLYHFDMPVWAYEIGGWENLEVVEAYAYYAKKCFELFGNKVKFWTTFNEPMVPVEGGYLYDFHLPCLRDGRRAVNVAYHTQLASSLAVLEFKKMRNRGDLPQDSKIGIILNLTPSYPRDEQDPEDVKAANYCDLFFNRSFLDPSVLGKYPSELVDVLKQNDVLPEYKQEDLDIIANNTVDFLGVNYYQPRRAKARQTKWDSDDFMPDKYFESYQMPGAKMNPYRGWEIYEPGIYDIAINLRDNYNNIEFYVSENGMGVEGEHNHIIDGQVQDDYRIEFIRDHLKWLHKAINEGANCFGYHIWTFIDCWSWTNAYKNRYGFVALDLETQKRTIKKSGEWFYQMTKDGGFE